MKHARSGTIDGVGWLRIEAQRWWFFALGFAIAPRPKDGPHVFTHHKRTSWFAIVGVIVFLAISEGAVFHLWLHAAGHTVAMWISFAAHAYSVVWLVGDAQGVRVYRSWIDADDAQPMLTLRLGLRGQAEIPLSNIAAVTIGHWQTAGEGEAMLKLTGGANVRIAFVEPIRFSPMRRGDAAPHALLVQMDEPERFKAALSGVRATRLRAAHPLSEEDDA